MQAASVRSLFAALREQLLVPIVMRSPRSRLPMMPEAAL